MAIAGQNFMWNMSHYNICHHWWRYYMNVSTKVEGRQSWSFALTWAHSEKSLFNCWRNPESISLGSYGIVMHHSVIILYRSCFKRRDERCGQVSLLALHLALSCFLRTTTGLYLCTRREVELSNRDSFLGDPLTPFPEKSAGKADSMHRELTYGLMIWFTTWMHGTNRFAWSIIMRQAIATVSGC